MKTKLLLVSLLLLAFGSDRGSTAAAEEEYYENVVVRKSGVFRPDKPIRGTKGHAVDVRAPNVTIIGAKIVFAKGVGIRAHGGKYDVSGLKIINCTVDKAKLQGFGLYQVHGAVIRGNRATNCGTDKKLHHGFYVSGKGLTYENNYAANNAAFGHHFYQEWGEVRGVKDSVIKNNKSGGGHEMRGMVIQSKGGNTISGNDMSKDDLEFKWHGEANESDQLSSNSWQKDD